MACPSCGADSSGDYKFCPKCGYQYDAGVQRPVVWSQAPARRNDSKVVLIIIIVVVVAIVVPVILSALLYVMVLGFGGTDGAQTPAAFITRSSVSDGMKFTLSPITHDTTWDDVEVILSDGVNSVSWSPTSVGWSQTGYAVYSGSPQMLGGEIVWFNVTDLAGNYNLNQGDFFTFTTGAPYQFVSGATYTVYLMYEPTGGSICQDTFTL